MKIFEEMSSFIKRHSANVQILFYADLNLKFLSYTEQEKGKMEPSIEGYINDIENSSNNTETNLSGVFLKEQLPTEL